MKHNTKVGQITSSPIGPLLIKLTIPTIFGMLGFSIFNIVDTYFIGKMGITELSAISFTFPVVMLINSFNIGIATGVMALFTRAAGNQNYLKERQLATASLMLGLIISATITMIGLLTIDPLFRAMGAGEDLLPHIHNYMTIWYFGSIFIVIPMIGDNILRGMGDTKTPSFVMLTAAVVNIVLDPLLIFGLGPFPELGIQGAALATVFARMITMLVSLSIQIFREHLINFKELRRLTLLEDWKNILYLGIPNSLVKMVMPVGAGIFTAILAIYGNETVAGYGVAVKIESFAMAIVQALSVTTAIFVGQNIGAQKIQRVKKGIRMINLYSLGFGVITGLFFFIVGRYLGAIFSDDTTVQHMVELYLLIVPIGYGFNSITMAGSSTLNVLHKPIHGSLISVFQIFVVNIPLALLLSPFWGATGVFISIVMTYVISSLVTHVLVKGQLNKFIKVNKMS